MLWFGLLVAVVVIVLFASLTGVKPKGTRPVERSGLMAAARVVLVVLAALIVYVVWVR